MKDNNYITLPAWVVTDVMEPYDLSLTESMVYAIVYGFSQDGVSSFYGSARYMCGWLHCSRDYIYKIFTKLVSMGLLEKETIVLEGRSAPSYRAVLPGEVHRNSEQKHTNSVHIPSALSSEAISTESAQDRNSVQTIYKRKEKSYRKEDSGAAPAQAPSDVPEDPSGYIEACRRAIRGEGAEDAGDL